MVSESDMTDPAVFDFLSEWIDIDNDRISTLPKYSLTIEIGQAIILKIWRPQLLMVSGDDLI